MTDYTELVKALRYCVSGVCKNCSYFEKCKKNGTAMAQLHDDAAAAIEELQDTVQAQDKTLKECARQLAKMGPKRGEWIDSKERMRPDMCSVCGCVYEADRFMDKIVWNYCPNCGAKMTEVQE